MIPPADLLRKTDCYLHEREALFSPSATKSSDAVRRYKRKSEDIRTPYSRDSDRILHSRAYARYIDKTQVFSLLENDHITHRVLHVQLVSKIARTVGRSLRLNEDLIEAIALGHDIGHIPFGHFGEKCLSLICEREGIGSFRHNLQGVRFLDEIEDLDLTLQVLDGILCHDGESQATVLSPVRIPDDDAFAIFDRKVRDVAAGDPAIPATPEGCVVRFSDTIAYIARDLRDAAEVGLIHDFTDLPPDIRSILGENEGEIINRLTLDLITTGNVSIGFSEAVGSALNLLKKYNYEHIYEHEKTRGQDRIIRTMFEVVFTTLKENLEDEERNSKIFTDYLDTPWISSEYKKSISDAGVVRDFIAGMTDRYFERLYSSLVLPKKVESYRL
ncbi:deoxyguanosinetriphosphate triphosphohydrolase family protein [Methanocalculus sp.]|uniref:deoxyguanosinetriphosphate triphosphohydrolase family protein n=1 Tax=Methanocalculus sp. TaxID=2004547 RepID=UPI0027289B1E|nr:HD domain-containing protein [Methanocalculus sp.]MDO8841973.1 HD domain-containing protein [Methanocalculus sp.]